MKKMPKKLRVILFAVLLIAPFICVELVSRNILESNYDEKEKKALRVLLGLEEAVDATMVALYKPHHYLGYVLNPESARRRNDYFDSTGYSINRHGYRGKDFSLEKPEGTYRIVCLGGSTTFGQGEKDERLTYPQILEDILNERLSSPAVEVINAGTPAWTSAELLINLHFRILELSPDMIIVYEGVNDTFAMSRDGEGKSDYSNFRRPLNYVQPGSGTKGLLRYSAFFQLLYIGANDVSTDITRLTITPVPAWTNEDKNLEKATGKYFRRNIESLVAITRANNIATVLVTMGHGPWHFSLGLNNAITRDIAETMGTVFVDFENTARPSYFTADQVHLKKSGNTALAREIAAKLLKPESDFFTEKKKSASTGAEN